MRRILLRCMLPSVGAFLVLVCGILQITAVADDGKVNANVRLRGSLNNSRVQFLTQKKGHVAFIGGSITEMNGYRPMVCEILQRRFPETQFTFTDAGIASTCSTTGAFRLTNDVLSKGPLDLFFVEFAVNDDQDAVHPKRECVRGMEGIILQVRKHNPKADVIIVHFVNPPIMEALQDGRTPVSVGAHEEVAHHYGISTIHLAREVTERIAAGGLTWEKFGGTHPAPFGNSICAGMIDALLTQSWTDSLGSDPAKQDHPTPHASLDPRSYDRGHFVNPGNAQHANVWKWHVPNWADLPGQCRRRFADVPLLCADEPGCELSLAFEGTTVGAYLLAGPDAGTVDVVVDDRVVKQVDLHHRFSRGLHYPRTVIFATDLSPGEHELRLRISSDKNAQSTGHAVRLLQFTVN